MLVQRLRTEPVPPIVISKSPDIIQSLACYLAGDVKEDKFLTPTALNTYLDCPLSFYYKYVLGVREREEVSPDFNALLFGNILHKAMEIIYGEIAESGGGLITAGSIENQQSKIDTAVGKCFAMQFGIGRAEDFRFEGRNVLGREIITRMIRRIMEIDAAYAPFTIQGLEKRMISRVTVSGNGKSFTVNIRGIIDRIDSRNGKVRIVDYKSGRDFRQFNSVEALFGEEEDKRNKAVFQTLFYSMALAEAEKMDRPAIPCLYNSREIYLEDFDPMLRMGPDKDPVIPDQSILKEQILPEFRKRLEGLLLEIFDPAVPFRHREEGRECPFCQRAGFPT